MRAEESMAALAATEIERQSCRTATKMSRETKFSKCAKIIWDKPAAAIAAIANCDIRTAQRMLAGEAEIPWCIRREVLDEFDKSV
jgi:hypothetical protein